MVHRSIARKFSSTIRKEDAAPDDRMKGRLDSSDAQIRSMAHFFETIPPERKGRLGRKSSREPLRSRSRLLSKTDEQVDPEVVQVKAGRYLERSEQAEVDVWPCLMNSHKIS
jgi:hypothetical protein